jgi:DNA-binding transcriptional LysR family regulator
MVFIY